MRTRITRRGIKASQMNAAIAAAIASAKGAWNYVENDQWLTLTALIPADDTPPQKTEGTEILSAPITLKSIESRVVIFSNFHAVSGTSGSFIGWAAFRNGVSNALKSLMRRVNADHSDYSLLDIDNPGVVGEVTYSINLGGSTGSVYLNGNASGPVYGDSCKATLFLLELLPP